MSRLRIAILLTVSLPLLSEGYLRAETDASLGPSVPSVGIKPFRTLPDSARSVSLQDLLEEAMRLNPEILAAQKKYEGSRLRPSIVSTLPDPFISINSNNIGSPIPATTLGEEDMSQLGVSFMQEIPFPGKLNLQGKMAEKESEGEWSSYQETQRRVASEVKQSFYQWYFVYKAIDVLQRNTSLLGQFSKIAEARYQVGQGNQQDVLRAQMEVSMLERRRLELEREREALIARINTLLSRPPDSPLGAPADFPRSQLPVNLNDLYETITADSPRLAQEQARIEQNTLALELSRKDYYPDFSVEAGWASRGSLRDMWETRVQVRLPLYFWRKQRYAVRESAQAVEQARHDYDATRQALLFRIKDDYLAAKTSEQLLALYSKTLMPQSSLTLESAMASYQTGKIDFLSLVTNFQSVLGYELEYFEQFAQFHEALARLEETTGRQLIR